MSIHAAPQSKVAMPLTPTFTAVRSGLLQPKCACGGTPGPSGECEECRKKRVQRKVAQSATLNSQPSDVGPNVGGLPRSVAHIMESHFGVSFADVKIHADQSAARDAFERGAAAYTK